jgi:hypothetical protein
MPELLCGAWMNAVRPGAPGNGAEAYLQVKPRGKVPALSMSFTHCDRRPLYERLRAIASISIRAPRGSAATCTVARAG